MLNTRDDICIVELYLFCIFVIIFVYLCRDDIYKSRVQSTEAFREMGGYRCTLHMYFELVS